MQNGADEIEVTPDGTVLAGTEWDEAGRCAGLYKDGRPGRVLLRGPDGGKETAWGWNTGNNALAVSGEHLYIANTGKRLLHFVWKPGDINSGRYVDEVETPEKAVGLTARDKTLVVVYPNVLEIRDATTLKPLRSIEVKGAQDAAIARDGSLWVLAGKSIRRYSPEGRDLSEVLPGQEKPAAPSIDPKDRLIVTDDGPRQQVLFFDIASVPRLISTFGRKGGIASGVPGEMKQDPGVGWLDTPYSVQALRRKNGEYLILVEEDWRGKNLLYRWKPAKEVVPVNASVRDEPLLLSRLKLDR